MLTNNYIICISDFKQSELVFVGASKFGFFVYIFGAIFTFSLLILSLYYSQGL